MASVHRVLREGPRRERRRTIGGRIEKDGKLEAESRREIVHRGEHRGRREFRKNPISSDWLRDEVSRNSLDSGLAAMEFPCSGARTAAETSRILASAFSVFSAVSSSFPHVKSVANFNERRCNRRWRRYLKR